MNCGPEAKREVMSLILGELSPQAALAAERHAAACPACAALRLALLEERAGLSEAGAPLLAAGQGLAGAVAAAAAGGEAGGNGLVFASALLAAGFAVFLLLAFPSRSPEGGTPGSAITPPLMNTEYSVPGGEAQASDFCRRMSVRAEFPAYRNEERS